MSDQLDLFDVGRSPVGRSVAAAEDDLPPVAKEILALTSSEALVRIVNKWGGVHMDFPARAESFHTSKVVQELADEIGQADAWKVASYFQGVRLQVPKCAAAVRKLTERKIRDEMDRGVAVPDLARRFNLTERSIWRIAKRV